MIDKNDWRLQGQEKYLKGVTLYLKKYITSGNAWDHDHCEFCWAKFMVEDYPRVLHIGYATMDEYHWVCEACFKDFEEMFGWPVIESIE